MSGPVSARYRFGDARPVGVVLGLGVRQAAPIVAGVLFLALALLAGAPVVGMAGPAAGMVVAFGRWRRAPLYEVAVPGFRLGWARLRGRSTWTRASLLGAGPGHDDHTPVQLAGLELIEATLVWPPGERTAGVIRDRPAGTVSVVLAVSGRGFPVASAADQDGLVGVWGAALAPLARAQCPVRRVTWQEWTRPAGVDGHRSFLAGLDRPSPHTRAAQDYEALLADQAPFTNAHEVLVTLTADLRRVRARHRTDPVTVAIEVLGEETRQLGARLEAAGFTVTGPLTPVEVSTAVRLRSDPGRTRQIDTLRRSLAAATGRGGLEWGPMAVAADWSQVRVDGSVHRSYTVAAWPMLAVTADWLAPLLGADDATRTVTVVMEPVGLTRAAADANRALTSIEADAAQKQRHGFRLTARERRRQDDIETRERELAEGHPLFAHAALITVTAPDADSLEDAAARVEQAAAAAMLDLRPLAARQAQGWVASLPLGRSIRPGRT